MKVFPFEFKDEEEFYKATDGNSYLQSKLRAYRLVKIGNCLREFDYVDPSRYAIGGVTIPVDYT